MATRQETRAKREALKAHLRVLSQQAAGETRLMQTVRELAGDWNLSVNLVLTVQRELVEEGVLRIAPRVGTFVGQTPSTEKVFLLVFGPEAIDSAEELLPKAGFEDRTAQLGGAVLTLDVATALHLDQRGELCPIAGVFDYSTPRVGGSEWLNHTKQPNLPRVRFRSDFQSQAHTDFVSFEDEQGGWQATRHLLARKHKRIAYLAFHPRQGASAHAQWSLEREQGWQRALQEANLRSEGLAFHPQQEHLFQEIAAIRQAMKEPVQALLSQPDISAVVTANDTIAESLLHELQSGTRPTAEWPSIVSFDGGSNVKSQILTSLRTPWDELGAAAADLLWSRAHNLVSGPSQQRRVAMRLIPRLTCHSGRNYAAAHASLICA